MSTKPRTVMLPECLAMAKSKGLRVERSMFDKRYLYFILLPGGSVYNACSVQDAENYIKGY